jgi:hypothetical protein
MAELQITRAVSCAEPLDLIIKPMEAEPAREPARENDEKNKG